MSVELLKKFNPDGNVNALEFLVGMLTYGGIVDKERDIDPILRKFIQLDKNKKGILSLADLKDLRNSIHVRETTRDSSFKVVMDDVMDIIYNRHHEHNSSLSSITTGASSPMHEGNNSFGSQNQIVVEGNVESVIESL